MIKDTLIKLGHHNPGLRDEIEPVLDHLSREAGGYRPPTGRPPERKDILQGFLEEIIDKFGFVTYSLEPLKTTVRGNFNVGQKRFNIRVSEKEDDKEVTFSLVQTNAEGGHKKILESDFRLTEANLRKRADEIAQEVRERIDLNPDHWPVKPINANHSKTAVHTSREPKSSDELSNMANRTQKQLESAAQEIGFSAPGLTHEVDGAVEDLDRVSNLLGQGEFKDSLQVLGRMTIPSLVNLKTTLERESHHQLAREIDKVRSQTASLRDWVRLSAKKQKKSSARLEDVTRQVKSGDTLDFPEADELVEGRWGKGNTVRVFRASSDKPYSYIIVSTDRRSGHVSAEEYIIKGSGRVIEPDFTQNSMSWEAWEVEKTFGDEMTSREVAEYYLDRRM